jgi:hypothetical protein
MMSLKLMNDVVHTSKDDTSTFVDTILQRWAARPRSARFFRASANFLFTFTNDGAPYALRFNHARDVAPRLLRLS